MYLPHHAVRESGQGLGSGHLRARGKGTGRVLFRWGSADVCPRAGAVLTRLKPSRGAGPGDRVSRRPYGNKPPVLASSSSRRRARLQPAGSASTGLGSLGAAREGRCGSRGCQSKHRDRLARRQRHKLETTEGEGMCNFRCGLVGIRRKETGRNDVEKRWLPPLNPHHQSDVASLYSSARIRCTVVSACMERLRLRLQRV